MTNKKIILLSLVSILLIGSFGIYNFLDIPYYKKHRFTNLDQVDGQSLQTTIRTDKIEKKYILVK